MDKRPLVFHEVNVSVNPAENAAFRNVPQVTIKSTISKWVKKVVKFIKEPPK
jgi:hypothetical protein